MPLLEVTFSPPFSQFRVPPADWNRQAGADADGADEDRGRRFACDESEPREVVGPELLPVLRYVGCFGAVFFPPPNFTEF